MSWRCGGGGGGGDGGRGLGLCGLCAPVLPIMPSDFLNAGALQMVVYQDCQFLNIVFYRASVVILL